MKYGLKIDFKNKPQLNVPIILHNAEKQSIINLEIWRSLLRRESLLNVERKKITDTLNRCLTDI